MVEADGVVTGVVQAAGCAACALEQYDGSLWLTPSGGLWLNTYMTSTATLSPYTLRQYATNLRAFGADSALRQIDLHVTRGDFNEADAVQLRRIVTDHTLWMF